MARAGRAVFTKRTGVSPNDPFLLNEPEAKKRRILRNRMKEGIRDLWLRAGERTSAAPQSRFCSSRAPEIEVSC